MNAFTDDQKNGRLESGTGPFVLNSGRAVALSPSIGLDGCGGISKMLVLKNVKVLYVMGKVLSGELSCMRTSLVELFNPHCKIFAQNN